MFKASEEFVDQYVFSTSLRVCLGRIQMEIPWKHWIHSLAMLATIFVAIRMTINVDRKLYPGNEYSWPIQIILYILTMAPLSQFPLSLYAALGLLFYDCFPGQVQLKANLDEVPTICFRVVTRGSFPKLILNNLKRNLSVCRELQLRKYLAEIVTETPIDGLRDGPNTKQTIVPQSYTTPKGTLFKARNLQYALDKSDLKEEDWIVHLDEDSILTSDAVRGVCNFIFENKYRFGIGPIDSNSHGTVDVLTESLDIFPLLDYGLHRFESRFLNNCLNSLRTTFLVANVGDEKKVTFDVEAGPSMVEDAALGLLVLRAGYAIGGVDGKVLEQSAPSVSDVVGARARCIIGYFHICFNSSYYSLTKCKYFTLFVIIVCLVFSLTLPSLLCSAFFPVYLCPPLLYVKGFMLGFFVYGQIFIVLKNRHGSSWEYVWRATASVVIGPILTVFVFQLVLLRIYKTRHHLQFSNTKKVE